MADPYTRILVCMPYKKINVVILKDLLCHVTVQ